MEAQRPSLQLANTDGTGPVKRRRAALSCVECRRRKVKCDRERPCGPCTRSKSPTCTFRPPPKPNPQVIGRPVNSPISGSTSQSQDGSTLVSPPQATATNQTHDFDSMLNRYIAPGIFGVHGKGTLGPLPRSQDEASNPTPATTIRSLVDRVRDLEGRLTALSEGSSSGDSSGSINMPIRDAPCAPAGQFVKSKFYGESHWVNCIEPYEALGHIDETITINPSTNRTEFTKSTKLYAAMLECKRMARSIKSARVSHPTLSPEIQASIPPKDVCDQLVKCYLRTFEGVFRVLHIPTFMSEYEHYWTNTAAAKPSVLTKILLVCAIGVPFYTSTNSTQPRLHSQCTLWIHAAESWLSAPHEKSRLNMAGLQIHILLLLARQICSVDGDLMWIPAGALLRSAMHLGLHRDPANFPKISVFHGEMRRRLWATVLEITAQSSLDMGMPPLISLQDFDTRPPLNVNDEDIGEKMGGGAEMKALEERPAEEFTQTSIQIAMNQTLSTRLEIIRLINNLRSEMSYDDVLSLGTQLLASCRTNGHRFQPHLTPPSTSPSLPTTTPFQLKLLDVLVRRFILCLHRPFFAKATTNPKYYYSRKICLDTSISILNPASPSPNPSDTPLGSNESEPEDDWQRLMTHGVGFVKSFFLYSISTVYLELAARIEEAQEEPPMPVPASHASSPSAALPARPTIPSPPPPLLPPDFQALRSLLVAAKHTAESRVRRGETNAKGVLFLACALARIDALAARSDAEAAVLEAAENGVAECASIMRFANADADLGLAVDGDGRFDENLGFGGLGFEGSPESWFVGGWDGVGG
ncbi:hypothetical protein K505DRAFT_405407 [Melanomma pulvis-pyrius CBS 109.77]|uniref:Zn(2)-C6 fungal-type domain-containing protein n=1 Tax=Melanomma pulvis-pyrius CBS 109.77 TaxID=1314802 RepID=A0A6A6XRE2_9PLEO|nr:hypothetical protein K505DRAFT_405407 [Melanomma pulvis-pyrius CBS 109.77]